MICSTHIDPDAIYDDDALSGSLQISSATLSRARRDGQLCYSRKGQRILYLGKWVLDWIKKDAIQEAAHGR